MTGTSEKCIACYPKIEQGLQPQCFLNCIGKIRLAGFLSEPAKARADNPVDYLVHIRKVALPLFPQFGLEPNVYYIPPVHASLPFLRQMFGPGAEAAVKTYRAAANDPDLSGLLCLIGSTESIIHRWNRQGENVSGMDEKGAAMVRVPLREPVHVRAAFDPKFQIVRTNCP
jgi:nitrate reductase beta subunit